MCLKASKYTWTAPPRKGTCREDKSAKRCRASRTTAKVPSLRRQFSALVATRRNLDWLGRLYCLPSDSCSGQDGEWGAFEALALLSDGPLRWLSHRNQFVKNAEAPSWDEKDVDPPPGCFASLLVQAAAFSAASELSGADGRDWRSPLRVVQWATSYVRCRGTHVAVTEQNGCCSSLELM